MRIALLRRYRKSQKPVLTSSYLANLVSTEDHTAAVYPSEESVTSAILQSLKNYLSSARTISAVSQKLLMLSYSSSAGLPLISSSQPRWVRGTESQSFVQLNVSVFYGKERSFFVFWANSVTAGQSQGLANTIHVPIYSCALLLPLNFSKEFTANGIKIIWFCALVSARSYLQ